MMHFNTIMQESGIFDEKFVGETCLWKESLPFIAEKTYRTASDNELANIP